MTYALESEREFERLEHQSSLPEYDYRREWTLAGIAPSPGHRLLDAGCGSGVLTRYLARQFPDCEVVGWDAAAGRLEQARAAARELPNVRFEVRDLTGADELEAGYDVIVCRYVLEHLSEAARALALGRLYRSLAPGGRLVAIDIDGLLFNLYPQPSPWLQQALRELEASCPIDLRVGRKLPQLLLEAGFAEVDWRAELVEFRGEQLANERRMTAQRLGAARGMLEQQLGGFAAFERFCAEYLAALDLPGCVLFYNKFVVCGRRSALGEGRGAP